MCKWNIQAEHDLYNEEVDWKPAYYNIILNDGRERIAKFFKDECNGLIQTHYELLDTGDALDFDRIVCWRKQEQ